MLCRMLLTGAGKNDALITGAEKNDDVMTGAYKPLAALPTRQSDIACVKGVCCTHQ